METSQHHKTSFWFSLAALLLIPVNNVLLLWWFVSVPLWIIVTYHVMAAVGLLAVLAWRGTPRHIKQIACYALIGGILGCLAEVWLMHRMADALFESAMGGLAP